MADKVVMMKSASFFAFIYIIFSILSFSGSLVEGKLCERASQTWSWSCRNTGGCDNQCKTWERALHGACHTRDGNKKCFCYYKTCSAPKLCEKASQTWSGTCLNTKGCDRQCKNWEKAWHGACHSRNGKKKCFCYFKGSC